MNEHMDYVIAVNSQMEQGQNIPDPSEQPERLLEPMGSPCLTSVEETSKSELDMVDAIGWTPLLPEEEDKFPLRHFGHKRRALVQHTLPVFEAESEEPDPMVKRPRTGYKKNNRALSLGIDGEG
eukprot:g36161.t1